MMEGVVNWATSGLIPACTQRKMDKCNVRYVESGVMKLNKGGQIPTTCPDCGGRVRTYAELDVPINGEEVKKTFAKCWTCRRRWVKSVKGAITTIIKAREE